MFTDFFFTGFERQTETEKKTSTTQGLKSRRKRKFYNATQQPHIKPQLSVFLFFYLSIPLLKYYSKNVRWSCYLCVIHSYSVKYHIKSKTIARKLQVPQERKLLNTPQKPQHNTKVMKGVKPAFSGCFLSHNENHEEEPNHKWKSNKQWQQMKRKVRTTTLTLNPNSTLPFPNPIFTLTFFFSLLLFLSIITFVVITYSFKIFAVTQHNPSIRPALG